MKWNKKRRGDGICIESIKLTLGNTIFDIKPCNFRNTDDTMLVIEDKQTILNYYDAYNKFSKKALHPDYVSYYHPSTIEIEEQYPFFLVLVLLSVI